MQCAENDIIILWIVVTEEVVAVYVALARWRPAGAHHRKFVAWNESLYSLEHIFHWPAGCNIHSFRHSAQRCLTQKPTVGDALFSYNVRSIRSINLWCVRKFDGHDQVNSLVKDWFCGSPHLIVIMYSIWFFSRGSNFTVLGYTRQVEVLLPQCNVVAYASRSM